MKHKSGQVSASALGALAIVLITAAITIAIGGEVLNDVQSNIDAGASYYNKTTSFTATNNTVYVLAGFDSNNRIDRLVIFNDTGCAKTNIPTNTTSWTRVGNQITVKVEGDPYKGVLGYNSGDTWCVSYNWTNLLTEAYNATQGGLKGTNTFGDWLDTIALVLVAAVVIGIITTSFVMKQD